MIGTTGWQTRWDLPSSIRTEDGDFARDGLHLDGREKRRLGQLYARVSGLDVEGSAGSKK